MFRKSNSTDSCGQMKYLKSDTLPKMGPTNSQWAGAWKLPKINFSLASMALSVSKTREKIEFNKKNQLKRSITRKMVIT